MLRFSDRFTVREVAGHGRKEGSACPLYHAESPGRVGTRDSNQPHIIACSRFVNRGLDIYIHMHYMVFEVEA